MHDIDECLHAFEWRLWRDAMPEVYDVPPGRNRGEQRACRVACWRWTGHENRGIEIALKRLAGSNGATERGQVLAPIHREGLAVKFRVSRHEVRRILHEENARFA